MGLNETTNHERRVRPLLGLGLLGLFAAGLLFGILYGDKVIWRLGLEPRILEPLPIFMYHNVAPDGTECNSMTVTVSKLREDFDRLNECGCTTILPRELVSGEELPERPVLLTFDDGYVSNYELLFPLLKEYHFKAVISPVVYMPDNWAEGFCTWEMYRKMTASGLVEVGSHTVVLHNLDHQGVFSPDGDANGIQRKSGESDEAFQVRVLDDIQRSYDRIAEETGQPPVFFAYPYGKEEPDAQELIDRLFPVSVLTWEDHADLTNGTARMPRWTMTTDKPMSDYVKPDGPWHDKSSPTD